MDGQISSAGEWMSAPSFTCWIPTVEQSGCTNHIWIKNWAQHVRQVNLSIYVNSIDWILGWSWCIWGVSCWRNLWMCINNTSDSFELYLVLGIAAKQVFSRFLFWLWKLRVMLGSRCNFLHLFFTMSQLLSSIQIVGLNRSYIFFIQCWDKR